MSSRAENLAQKIIYEYGICDPQDILLEGIAYERGVIINEKPIKGAEGRLITDQANGIIVVNSNIREPGKKRFVIAHELGHFALHRDSEKISICDQEAFIDWHKNRPYETEANEFAAELLMPTSIFRKACQSDEPNAEIVKTMAEMFDTTLTATAIRYVEIGWFPAVLVCTHNKIIRWYRRSIDFPYYFLPIGTEISKQTSAFDFFEKGIVPENPEIVLPTAWFDDHRLIDQYFYEHCLVLPSYNIVLSLIWEYEV